MALTKIDLGTSPNDGTGDTLRDAGGKMNTAFDVIDGNGTRISGKEDGLGNPLANGDVLASKTNGDRYWVRSSATLNYLGGWDAENNIPAIDDATGSKDDFYKVTVPGSRNLGSGTIDFELNDNVIHNGTAYERFPATISVTSVNGEVGAVVLDTDDIDEGAGNLYYTEARVTARLPDVINDNTSVFDKAWSSAKSNTHIVDVNNPHQVTKADIGLGNVEDTQPADLPISDDTQEALTPLQTDSHTHTNKALLDTVIDTGDGTNYLSDDGTYKAVSGGSGGDMTKAVYDTNGNGIVDDSELTGGFTVEIAVPGNAVFTDTIYDDTYVLKDADTNQTVDDSNKIATMADISASGGGDMLASVYDTDGSNVVDDSELVNGLTVETAVPVDAVFVDTDDHTQLSNIGANAHTVIDTHLASVENPHGVTASQANAEPANANIQTHISDVTSNPHAVTAALVGASPTDHNHDTRYFQQSLFVDESTGVAEGGSPVILNAQGLIDISMVDASIFHLVGTHDPSSGIEYPDTAGALAGSLWYIDELIAPTDITPEPYYTFVAGDLAGSNGMIGDFMAWGGTSWILMQGNMDPNLYYKLDGSSALTAPFAAGGQPIKDIADATEATDAVALGQVAPLLEDYVKVAGDTMDGDLIFSYGAKLLMETTLLSPEPIVYIDGTDTLIMNGSTLPVFAKGSWDFNLVPGSAEAPTSAEHLTRMDYVDTQVGTVDTALTSHTGAIDNPHSVTSLQVGLDYVINTGPGTNYLADDGTYKVVDIVGDITPQLGGELDGQGHSIINSGTVLFSGLFDNGTVVADFVYDPMAGQYQTIEIGADVIMTITAPATPCTTYLHIYQGSTGGVVNFPLAEWEDGIPLGNTTTPTTGHDLLVIHYTGTGYVLGMMKNLG